jgi:hypothetical protein
MYKITLDVYVNEQATYPIISVASQATFREGMVGPGATPADTEALERDLTATRKFAEELVRGVEVERRD